MSVVMSPAGLFAQTRMVSGSMWQPTCSQIPSIVRARALRKCHRQCIAKKTTLPLDSCPC